MNNVLGLLDQAGFDLGRGGAFMLQSIWVYNRPVDIDGLRQFHHQLQRGRLSRCIEQSPLPFGRHRWVSDENCSDMEIAPARRREEFDVWLDEQASTALDCEHGPTWQFGVLPFLDGGAGVSLFIPHCLTDGVGLCEALADAAVGRKDPIDWPAAGSRRRWQAIREDVYQTARDTAAIGRGVVAGVRLARRSATGPKAATTSLPAPPEGADEPIRLSTATIFIDADEWDARARSLGGTSNSLLVGLVARLANRRGRVNADGAVKVGMPVNERVPGDTRANAISHVEITIDPASATTDLREIRATVKRALLRHAEVPPDDQAVLSIVPLLPKRLVKVDPNASRTVSSNIGAVSPAASRPDGTDADSFAIRWLDSSATTAKMHQIGGRQFVLSGRARGQVFVSATAYQPLRPNSDVGLRQDLSGALDDFSLTGRYLCESPDHTPTGQ